MSGCCLTVAPADGPASRPRVARRRSTPLEFDIVAETLSRTTLGGLRTGSPVNLEHALTPATLMGGHFVQGHVDGLGRVVRVQTGAEWRVRIEPGTGADGEPLMDYVLPKGSICVDGVSLTVAGTGGPRARRAAHGWFEVALIPTTLRLTTLSGLKPGDSVNLEADLISKTVVNWLRHTGPAARLPNRRRSHKSKPG